MVYKFMSGVTAKDIPGKVNDLRPFPDAPHAKGTLQIVLPLPPKALHPNTARVHWAARAKATAKCRGEACFLTRDAIARQIGYATLPWKAATIQATFYFRDKRRRDKSNLNAWLKAAQDGIAEAGVVANDEAFTPLPPIVEVDKASPRVVVTIEET